MPFNKDYFHDGVMHQKRPLAVAFSTYFTPDNIIIGMFQGERGSKPELDFKVRILLEGENKKPVLPPHTYWVVDLMLKCVNNKEAVKGIAQYYLNFYNTCQPFSTQEARCNYELKTLNDIKKNFQDIAHEGTLSLDYVATIIELFCLNEKQNSGAYMFRDLLEKLFHYADGVANYIELLEAAKPGYR